MLPPALEHTSHCCLPGGCSAPTGPAVPSCSDARDKCGPTERAPDGLFRALSVGWGAEHAWPAPPHSTEAAWKPRVIFHITPEQTFFFFPEQTFVPEMPHLTPPLGQRRTVQQWVLCPLNPTKRESWARVGSPWTSMTPGDPEGSPSVSPLATSFTSPALPCGLYQIVKDLESGLALAMFNGCPREIWSVLSGVL